MLAYVIMSAVLAYMKPWGPKDLGCVMLLFVLLPRERLLSPPRPPSRRYLGLGSMLYLNFMRYMAVIYIVTAIFSIPNLYMNSLGDRCVVFVTASCSYCETGGPKPRCC